MNNLRGAFEKALNSGSSSKRLISLTLDEDLYIKLERIAKAFTRINENKNFSRNSIIEMIIQEGAEECTNFLLDEYNLVVGDDNLEQVSVNTTPNRSKIDCDLVIYSSRYDSFNEVFIDEKQWHAVRMSKLRKPHLKYVALYVEKPISGISHYGVIKEIKQYGNTDKKRIILDGPPIKLGKIIKLGDANVNDVRKIRYSTLEKLLAANEVKDLF